MPAEEELGARLGLQLALTDVTPGGMRVAAAYQTRMTGRTWFDGEVGFSFGGTQAGCVQQTTPPNNYLCEHGITDGFSLQTNVGFRGYFPQRPGGLVPYGRGALGVHFVYFSGDEQFGVGVPVTGAVGGRMAIVEGVVAVAEAQVMLGPGFWTKDVGLDAYSALAFVVGVDLGL